MAYSTQLTPHFLPKHIHSKQAHPNMRRTVTFVLLAFVAAFASAIDEQVAAPHPSLRQGFVAALDSNNNHDGQRKLGVMCGGKQCEECQVCRDETPERGGW